MQWTRHDWLILAALLLLAGALRFYQLGVVPPGPQFDEAFNAIDAEQILAGNRPLFLPANAGREPLYSYLQAGVGAIFGLNLYTLRLVSALAGALTVAALYVMVRLLFRRHSRTLATTTALALTLSLWHIHFSHYGIRVILMPLIYCGLFAALWLGLGDGTRRMRMTALAVAGLLAGLSVWTNPTGRFTPFIVLGYALYMLWQRPARRGIGWDNPLAGAGIVGGVALLVFLPLGLEFWRHPAFFFGHASEVSLFAERVSGGAAPWQTLLDHTVRVLGMFSFFGNPAWIHGLPGRPVFDWFMAVPFYIGLVVWARRLAKRGAVRPDPDRDALALFALWGAVMLLPSILSDAPPNFSRTLPAIPAVMLAAGLGLTWLATWPRLGRRGGPLLAATLITASGVIAVYDYFVRFADAPAVYYAYDAEKVDAAAWLRTQAATATVLLAPMWAEHPTLRFLGDDIFKPVDVTEVTVLPAPGQGIVYAYPAEQTDFVEAVADDWGAPVTRVADRYGAPLLAVVQLAAQQAASWPPGLAPEQTTTARFAEAPTLLGMRRAANGVGFALYWQAETSMLRDLTSLVQLIDARGRVVGQQDRAPGDQYYRTPTWAPGEQVMQRYTPTIFDRCAGGEPVRVVAAWYEHLADNQRRPRLDAPGDLAVAGSLRLPLLPAAPGEISAPNPTDLALGASLALKGFGLEGQPEPNAPLVLDLYLTGDPAQASTPLTVTLAAVDGDAAPALLWAERFAPATTWHPGEIICRRVHIRLPADLAPGAHLLTLHAPAGSAPVTTLAVTAATRSYALPPLAQPLGATFADVIQLAGANLVRAGDAITVTLGWQALDAPPAALTAFVHLLDPAGALVAQSDATPGGGYATTQWAPGEAVVDVHRLTLPPTLAPGSYRLVAGLYDPVTGQRAPVVDAGGAAYADQAAPLFVEVLP